jgi:hypothetical protein
MYGKPHSLHSQLSIVALLALAASGTALADDSSMSVLTGDSYAYFNNLDYQAGRFNVARGRQASPDANVAAMPEKEPAKAGKSIGKPEKPVMLADRPLRITLPSPFSDNKGA